MSGTIKRAYSYIRFSTPDQRMGDSLRRQIAAAEEWCSAQGYSLDSSLRDEGVSGYRKHNATSGALSVFLAAIRAGDVADGSVLIVESLDRLSRAEPLDALELLRDIIRAGVEVVTLQDRQRYSSASIREIGPLLHALVIMSRAHEESHTKSQRGGASWANKRTLASSRRIPLTRMVPAWIKVEGVRQMGNRHDWGNARFALIPDRVQVLREMFELRAEGWGSRRITNELNRREVPVWGNGKRRAKGGWQYSYVTKILAGRAVLGEFQPHRLEAGRNSRRIPVGDVIADFYPAAISKELWLAARAHSVSTAGTRGRQSVSALLSRLLRDPAGAPMYVERKGDGHNYYVTARPFQRPGKTTHRWRIDHLDRTVLSLVNEIDWRRVFADPQREPELRRLRARLSENESERANVQSKLKAAADRMLEPDFAELREQFVAAIAELKSKQVRLDDHRIEIVRDISAIEKEAEASEGGADRLRFGSANLSDEKTFVRLRREIRSLIKQITVYPDGQIDGYPVDDIRADAASRLHGNQGKYAREIGRVCGALRIEFANSRTLTVFVTYRPSARVRTAPVVLFADGVGYDRETELDARRHLSAL